MSTPRNLQSLKVYVINLDRRPDRWEMTQKNLRQAGFIDIERVSAVDGKLIDSNQLNRIVDPSVVNSLGKARKNHEDLGSVGAIGCYLSHYKVWNQIIESNKPAIIVEDDLICHPLLNEFSLSKNISPLKNFDFALLASCIREPHLLPSRRVPQGIYPYHGMFFLLHFYYITPVGARFFSYDALPIKYQVDSYMSFKIKENKDFRSGVHIPDMATQSNLSTDIQTIMGPGSILNMLWVKINNGSHTSTVVCSVLTLIFLFIIIYILSNILSAIESK
jgi:GR25 family glycosyltransferase involved in LPS biosynthesis